MKDVPNDRIGPVGANEQIAVGALLIRVVQCDAPPVTDETGRVVVKRDRAGSDRVKQRAVQCLSERDHQRTAQDTRWQTGTFEHGTVQTPKLPASWLRASREDEVSDA